ncbi:MAG: hypothetical protein ACOVO2_05255 [Emticicia sp.]|uniref:hypothetical protein n=1 Tax=Emticicia sp. TaxID=1930953 RepID=UPI003BA751D8
MKKLIIITIAITLTIISCKKETEVDATTAPPPTPKSYISKLTINEVYNNKKTRDQEFSFSYDSKGRLESIAQTYIYYDFNTGAVSSKNQSTAFISYNSENLASEVKTLNKISDGTESINIDRFIYDKDKVAEIRSFSLQNGIEKASSEILIFNYNNKGQLTSTSMENIVRSSYNYTNDVHISTNFFATSKTEVLYQENVLNPIANFSNAQKIIVSRIIEDPYLFGFGLISKFYPKKTVSGNTTWDYEVSTNNQNLPTKVLRNYFAYNVIQTMNFEYKTF